MFILHGLDEVAGQGINTVKGLKKNGYKASMVVYWPDSFNLENDINLKVNFSNKLLYPWYVIKLFFFLIYSLFRYDTFHFHFGKTILPKNLDLPILKIFNKKIFLEYHGSDLRIYENTRKNNNYFILDWQDYPNKALINEKRAKYANGIIFHDYELISDLPKNTKKLYYVPLRVDLSEIKPIYPDIHKKKITIVTSTSDKAKESNDLIFKAIDELEKQYNIEFIAVKNTPYEEALKIYQNADIIIDKLYLGTYGVFAIEAMAMGKPVLCYIYDEVYKTFPSTLPIVNTNFDNLKENLEELILNGKKRNELGKMGYEYANKYHNHVKNTKILGKIYEGKWEDVGAKETFEKIDKMNF